MIAGTTPFWGGSWRHIWARDVAFLHFSQIASLRPRSAGKVLQRNVVRQHFWSIVRSKGGGLGKMKKCDISGPNLPPGTTPKRGGSCDQYMALQAQLNDESFIHFVTQKTNLGEKVINLSLRQFAIFFCFFCSWCKAFFCSWCRHFFIRGARLS